MNNIWNQAIEEAAKLVEEKYDELEPWLEPSQVRDLKRKESITANQFLSDLADLMERHSAKIFSSNTNDVYIEVIGTAVFLGELHGEDAPKLLRESISVEAKEDTESTVSFLDGVIARHIYEHGERPEYLYLTDKQLKILRHEARTQQSIFGLTLDNGEQTARFMGIEIKLKGDIEEPKVTFKGEELVLNDSLSCEENSEGPSHGHFVLESQ